MRWFWVRCLSVLTGNAYGCNIWWVASCLGLQGNQQLQQQIDMLRQEACDKAISFGNQAQELTAEKTALQQELTGMSQRLEVAESGKSELQEQQDLWKSKCSKFQLVGHLQSMSFLPVISASHCKQQHVCQGLFLVHGSC